MRPMPFLRILLFFISLILSCSLFAQRPFSDPIEGQTNSSYGTTIGSCKMSSLVFKYRLSTVTGEPAIYLNLKWQNAYGTDIDCLSGESFDLYIHVTVQYTDYWIPANGAFGVTPKGDNKWGMNPLSGSPDWDGLLLKNEPSKHSEQNFLSADYAKSAWKSGSLRVIGILLVEKDGYTHIFN